MSLDNLSKAMEWFTLNTVTYMNQKLRIECIVTFKNNGMYMHAKYSNMSVAETVKSNTVSTVLDSGGMDGLRRPVASPRGDYTQSVRGQAVHFFYQLVATVIVTGVVWKLVGIAKAHMQRTHARAGAIGVCDVPSTAPMPPAVNTYMRGARTGGAHAGAHIPGAQNAGACCRLHCKCS
jgi:hypothetical protein